MHKIQIDDDVFAVLASQARPFVETTENDVLRRLLLGKPPVTDSTSLPSIKTSERAVRRTSQPKLHDLLDAGIVEAGETVRHHQTRKGVTVRATVTDRGQLQTEDGTVHSSVSGALVHFVGSQVNGWGQWTHEPSGKTLDELRRFYMSLPMA